MAVVAHASSDRCLVRRVSTGIASFQHAGLAAGSGQNSLAVAESGVVPVGVGWDAMGWDGYSIVVSLFLSSMPCLLVVPEGASGY